MQLNLSEDPSCLGEDMILQIALNLPLYNIYSVCRVDKRFNNLICNNSKFWKLKYNYDYGNITDPIKVLYHRQSITDTVNNILINNKSPITLPYAKYLAYQLGRIGNVALVHQFSEDTKIRVAAILGYMDYLADLTTDKFDNVYNATVYLFQGIEDYDSVGYIYMEVFDSDKPIEMIVAFTMGMAYIFGYDFIVDDIYKEYIRDDNRHKFNNMLDIIDKKMTKLKI